jgi:hypothetical protein
MSKQEYQIGDPVQIVSHEHYTGWHGKIKHIGDCVTSDAAGDEVLEAQYGVEFEAPGEVVNPKAVVWFSRVNLKTIAPKVIFAPTEAVSALKSEFKPGDPVRVVAANRAEWHREGVVTVTAYPFQTPITVYFADKDEKSYFADWELALVSTVESVVKPNLNTDSYTVPKPVVNPGNLALSRVRFDFTQDINTLGTTGGANSSERLTVFCEYQVPGGPNENGMFLVLKSNTGWSIENERDILAIVNAVKAAEQKCRAAMLPTEQDLYKVETPTTRY